MMGTDTDWENWGSKDPYYGVYSSEKYRSKNLSAEIREEFFRSGETHISKIFDTIKRIYDNDFSPKLSLDFGCGVGRLIIPLAKRSEQVVGIDISPSMLAEAENNCSSLTNCKFALSDDELSLVTGDYDLIHSYIVFQHIPAKRGLRIIENLLNRVRPGGILVIHFIYRCNAPKIVRMLVRLRYAFPLINKLRNLYRGEQLSDPPMQMHPYDLESVIHKLNSFGYINLYQILDSWDNGAFELTTLFAQRTRVGNRQTGAANQP